jgi:K+-transporting ATPase KdpF subunit
MIATIIMATSNPVEANNISGYLIGAVIALFILGYLLYSLVKPEKF